MLLEKEKCTFCAAWDKIRPPMEPLAGRWEHFLHAPLLRSLSPFAGGREIFWEGNTYRSRKGVTAGQCNQVVPGSLHGQGCHSYITPCVLSLRRNQVIGQWPYCALVVISAICYKHGNQVFSHRFLAFACIYTVPYQHPESCHPAIPLFWTMNFL